MRRQISKLEIIRFRRWSRKGYAIFCSLGKSVVIGNLKKGIVEIALKKQSNVCVLSTVGRQDRTDEKEGESPDRDVADKILSLIILEIISLNRSRCVTGGKLLFSYLYYLYGRKSVQCILSPAFLCH